MRALARVAAVLLLLAGACLVASIVRPDMAQHGVALALLALLAVLAVAALEHLSANRTAANFEALRDTLRLAGKEIEQLRAEVDTLNRERALNRM